MSKSKKTKTGQTEAMPIDESTKLKLKVVGETYPVEAPVTEEEQTKQTAPDLMVVGKTTGEAPTTIAKPGKFNLDKFKSKKGGGAAAVETKLTQLSHLPLAHANDFARLHPDQENYWSEELCFVSVPIKGVKRDSLHLIDEDIAMLHLPAKRIKRFRLALASKPHDVFFLCHVPSQHLDNDWNLTNLQGCEDAMRLWTQITSLKEKGYEKYEITYARNQAAFPVPNWLKPSLFELIAVTFSGCMIETDNHPGLLRLVGDIQSTE